MPTAILYDILEEHFEALEFLLEQRSYVTCSIKHSSIDLAELEDRIEAHLNGILIDENTIQPVLEKYISNDEESFVFASALTLLQINKESNSLEVMKAFIEGSEDHFHGIRNAMFHGPIQCLAQQLLDLFSSGPSVLASAAGEVLAFHKQLDPNSSRLHEFFSDDDPEVRRTGWRILALLA